MTGRWPRPRPVVVARTVRARGVSLAELLVSLTLFSTAILVLVGVLPSMMHLHMRTQNHGIAITAATETLDRLLRAGTSVPFTPTSDPFPTPPGPPLPQMTRSYYGLPDPAGHERLQVIVVVVTWVEQSTEHRVQLSSAIALPDRLSVPSALPTASPTPSPSPSPKPSPPRPDPPKPHSPEPKPQSPTPKPHSPTPKPPDPPKPDPGPTGPPIIQAPSGKALS